MAALMKSVFVAGHPLRTEVRDVPIPSPGPNEVLIKVVACASNPKDWKFPEIIQQGRKVINQGQDMAGYVAAVGSNVYEFRKGDKVAASHPLGTPHGTYAEYSIAPEHTCFLIPPGLSFEEACTIPFALCTAALGFYQRLDLPFPTASSAGKVSGPIIIYGAASAIGAYSLQLAKLGKFKKVIAVCGQGVNHVKSLSAATHIIDYRSSTVVDELKAALGEDKCYHAIDAINNGTSWDILSQVVAKDGGGKIVVYLPRLDYSSVPKEIAVVITYYGTVDGVQTPLWDQKTEEDVEFGYAFFRLTSRWLSQGKLSPHPYEVLPYGLESIEDALKILQSGKVSAKKFVFRICDTPSLKTKGDSTNTWIVGGENIRNGEQEVVFRSETRL